MFHLGRFTAGSWAAFHSGCHSPGATFHLLTAVTWRCLGLTLPARDPVRSPRSRGLMLVQFNLTESFTEFEGGSEKTTWFVLLSSLTITWLDVFMYLCIYLFLNVFISCLFFLSRFVKLRFCSILCDNFQNKQINQTFNHFYTLENLNFRLFYLFIG